MERSRSSQSQYNRLLELLSEQDLALLRPHLQPVTFDYKLALCEADKPISFVYFLTSDVVSMVNTMADGSAAGVGTIGNEGLVGLPVILGDTPHQYLCPGSRGGITYALAIAPGRA